MREQARLRALDRCEVSGCKSRGMIADHIVSRRNGGSNTLDNLRWVCRLHDNQVKESASGARRSHGKARVPGCDASGLPMDPNHPWSRQRGS